MLRWILGVLLLLIVCAGLYLWFTQPRLPADLGEVANKYDVEILRDTWGVPHVFGTSDADAAFGLAYAHAEDDFATIQGALLAARGKLASVFGQDAAPNDYMVHLLRIWDVVDEKYETLDPSTQAVCQGYADGLNLYAAEHPDEAMAGLYPVHGKDVVAGFVHKLPLFFGIDGVLTKLFTPPEPDSVRRHITRSPDSPSRELGCCQAVVGLGAGSPDSPSRDMECCQPIVRLSVGSPDSPSRGIGVLPAYSPAQRAGRTG